MLWTCHLSILALCHRWRTLLTAAHPSPQNVRHLVSRPNNMRCPGLHSDADGQCRSCWRTLLWLDNWKRALLYVVLSVGCFVQLPRVWLTAISGLVFVAVSTVCVDLGYRLLCFLLSLHSWLSRMCNVKSGREYGYPWIYPSICTEMYVV